MSSGRRKGRLILVWGVLVVLIGIIYAVDRQDDRDDKAQAEIEARGEDRERYVISVPLEQVGALEVAHAGALHRFERDAEGVWLHHGAHAPQPGEHGHQADPALADAIRNRVVGIARARRERSLPYDPKTQDYGLANPGTLLLVYRKGEVQPASQFAFGDLAPDGVSRYVLEMGASQVFTVATYQYDNLVALVEEMAKASPGPAAPQPAAAAR